MVTAPALRRRPQATASKGENKAMSCGSRCQRSSRECDHAGTWLGFTCELPPGTGSWPTVCRGVDLPLMVVRALSNREDTQHPLTT